MDYLATLKEKLKSKPTLTTQQGVQIKIPVATNHAPVELKGVRVNVAPQGDALNEELKEFRRSVVGRKVTNVKGVKDIPPIGQAGLLQLQQQGVPIVDEEDREEMHREEMEIVERTDRKRKHHERKGTKEKTQKPAKMEEMEEMEGSETKDKKEKKERKDKKGEKAKERQSTAQASPGKEWQEILAAKPSLKTRPPNVTISRYYLNNREKFVNYINSIFQPYREEFLQDKSKISCSDISNKAREFRLLQHQRLVTDYMNLYTPYRGLLLYHGLGSGKTCTSIAVAEGMKSAKRVYVLTPAALKQNYIEQLQFCGDSIYKKNQHWEFVSTDAHPEAAEPIASSLGIPLDKIMKKKGAWLSDVSKPPNYDTLTAIERKAIDAQILEMIKNKYTFISYNGLRKPNLMKMNPDLRRNLFDNSVVIIDEAHNFVSRIVNKIGKEGEKKASLAESSVSIILYELLLSAKNARVVMLTGTPIINYPNEIGILFNILRGYIKTWEIAIRDPSGNLRDKRFQDIFGKEESVDFFQYSRSNILTVTRNPLGFTNRFHRDQYEGVANGPDITDEEFERRIVSVLRRENIELGSQGIRIRLNKALPDNLEDFTSLFIEPETASIKNEMLLKRRIIGLTSYFKSAQEGLMPRYDKSEDLYKVEIPMSDFQFGIYAAARDAERKQEKNSKKQRAKPGDIFAIPTSSYRIFSRLYCNFVMPDPPGRPLPGGEGEGDEKEKEDEDEKEDDTVEKRKRKARGSEDQGKEDQGQEDEGQEEEMTIVRREKTKKSKRKEFQSDDEFNASPGKENGNVDDEGAGDETYQARLNAAIEYVKDHADDIVSTSALQTYSPKFLAILEKIQDPENVGLHLVYSQFRKFEGVGLLKIVLEYHGFAEFKVKKEGSAWELDIREEDMDKPKFALYSGTESAEEKEMIRRIYNSEWDKKWPIYKDLRLMSKSNTYGDVIKVLMITASGSEGINLRNVRFVHIVEPYWNPTRLEQVIGRARRICSHTDLPEEHQTINVFIYLMTFTHSQMHGEANIELQLNDVSKRQYKTKTRSGHEVMDFKPLTSDEALFEISSMKESISNQLTTAVKEASIDCSIYAKRGSEPLRCLNFGEPSDKAFAYTPDFQGDELDADEAINKVEEIWEATALTLQGTTYASRPTGRHDGKLYDLESYKMSLKDHSIQPSLVATYHIDRSGDYILEYIG